MTRKLRIAVLYNSASADAGPQDQDTVLQARFVADLLDTMGHSVVIVAVADNLDNLRELKAATGAELAVNLVESLHGSSRGGWRAPALLTRQGLPFTGSDGPALLCSTNKLLAWQVLSRNTLPAPKVLDCLQIQESLSCKRRLPGSWIIKSVWEHASHGLDAGSVLHEPFAQEVLELLAQRRKQYAGQWYAEAFVAGREFSASLLAFPGGVQVLPLAEMQFSSWELGRPQIVDFAAKWLETDPAYENTIRSFRFSEQDAALLDELARLALNCWDAFGLSGYARVDFRIDHQNRPFIIDVNANPCLAPDAGFAASMQQAAIAPEPGLWRILQAGLQRGIHHP